VEELQAGRIVQASCGGDAGGSSALPRDEQQLLERWGVRSTLLLPAPTGDCCVPYVAIEDHTHLREWSESEIASLLTLAGGIGGALARHRAQSELHDARQLLERRVAERTAELAATNENLRQQVAERQLTEHALRLSEQKYRTIVEATSEGIWLTSAEDRITFINRRALAQLGFAEEEMIGAPVARFLPLPEGETLRSAFGSGSRAPQQDHSALQDWQLLRADGAALWVMISCAPQFGPDGEYRGSLLVITDITQRKELEQRLLHTDKMETVGRLAGGIAHDFNNLLTVISGYGDMLLERVTEPELRADLKGMVTAAERAASLTAQLLAFSRQQMAQPRVIDLNRVVSDMYRMLRRLIGEDIQLLLHLDSRLAMVKTDPTQMEQVIINLAVNARDAMPSGGTLTIRTLNGCKAPRVSANGGAAFAPAVKLIVSDSGAGMTAEVRSRAFEPFFTTKATGKGTGLGLASVYGIIRQNGGDVRIYSEVGVGTTFEIVLPSATAAASSAPEGTEPASPLAPEALSHPSADPAPARETILLVEDDDAVRSLTRHVLERQGFHVLAAGDPTHALSIAAEYSDPIDLVLTDVVMPQLSGHALAVRLRVLRPEAKIVFMSGYLDDHSLAGIQSDRDVPFIQKPFTPTALIERIRQILDSPDLPTAPKARAAKAD
jgi:two-component system, cell cycle sensor histidine kinase and response regulator CckA